MGPPSAKDDQADAAKGKQNQNEDPSPQPSPSKSFQNPLPGDEQIWKNCFLDFQNDFFLQSLAVTLSKLDYPAAVFWGFELVLIYNKAWEDAGGIQQQGRAQRGQLSPDAWHSLQKCITGGKPTKLSSHALLREKRSPEQEQYLVLASPLFGPDVEDARGVFCQMIVTGPESKTKNQIDSKAQAESSEQRRVANLEDLGLEEDSTPLDEHPFFHRFAEMIPTGLAILDHNARAVFVNQHFYELTTHYGEDQSFKSWPQSIHPEDYERVMGAYQEAFHGKTELRAEFRALGSDHPWRLLLLTPLGDENLRHVSLGEYGGFICSVVDITSEKSAEQDQRNAAEEAMKRKQQQEQFIDMISHEIRNPLSAMVHAVEDVNEALQDVEKTDRLDTERVADALDTINRAISHQKNIVDDVLAYSKLDSSMMALSPKGCQPEHDLRGIAKMLQPEFRKHDIHFECRVDQPYRNLNVDWAMADISRIGQVLINLLSNAVKFTSKKDGERKVIVKVSAATERPPSYPPDVVFFSTEKDAPRLDATKRPEWGDGEPLFIMVAVTDSGIGIGEEDQKKLFERFKQATPKTNEIYGGSGLGLNISRKFVQLHGGEIGVQSTEGDGATFGFFFRVRRSGPPGKEEKEEQKKQENNSARGQIRVGGLDSKVESSDVEHPAESRQAKTKSQLGRTQSAQERADQSQKLGKEIDQDRYDDSKRPQKKEDNASDDQKQQPRSRTDSQKQAAADQQGHDHGRDSDLATTGKSLDPTSQNNSPHMTRKVTDKAPQNVSAKGKAKESTQTPAPSSNTPDQPTEKQDSLPLRTRKDTSTPPHVLFVEDNEINRKLVTRKLTSKNLAVSTATNGREAVDFVVATFKDPHTAGKGDDTKRQREIDIILMDQEMPIMGGNAAAKEIRAKEKEMGRDRRVPILGVSANVREEQLREMIDCGMDQHITKPYDTGTMIGKIEEMIGE